MSAASPTLPDTANTAEDLDPVARGARSSAVFVALSVLQRAVPLLLLPVFTAVLTPDEYGRISVLLAVRGGFGSQSQYGLGFGIQHRGFAFDYAFADDDEVLGNQHRFSVSLGFGPGGIGQQAQPENP